MNQSYEYMRRIRSEEQDKLLGLRRERVTKALDGLTLHGDANAMLAQIAYAIHPHVGAWDEGACLHLRNVLAELIGGDHEAASDAQHRCACGAGGCHRGDESAEVGDQSHDSSSMRQENETGITDELREYVRIHETTAMFYTTMPPQVEDKPTHNGEKLLDIADRIDAQFARVCEQQEKVLQDTIEQMQGELEKLQSDYDEATTAVSNAVGKLLKLDHDVEMWRNRAEDICMECDELQVKLGESQAERDELQDTITNLLNLLRDARDEYKMLDRMSAETSANFHAMRDRVWGLEAERDELRELLQRLLTEYRYMRSRPRRVYLQHERHMRAIEEEMRELGIEVDR